MRKLVLFTAMAAILFAFGCNEENVYQPDANEDGRVIGTIQGVVTDAADATLLPGVEVSTTIRAEHVTTITDATGHYSFTNLDPGNYVLTFVFPEDKVVKDAYAGVFGEAYIPTVDEIRESYGDDFEGPTDVDFRHEVEANVNLYPLNGSAEGYVFVTMNAQSEVPAVGATILADFGVETKDYSGWTYALIDHEWFATTGEDGMYSFTGLPTGVDGMLRCLPYNHDGTYYDQQNQSLHLEDGGHFLADDFVLGTADAPMIIAQNWDGDVPFPAGGSFTATFNMAMDPATFVATLNWYDKQLVPVTVSWNGNTVTVDPDQDMVVGGEYYLTLAGWSTDGQAFEAHSWYVDIVAGVPATVIAWNFDDVPFPVGGNPTFTFNMAMDPSAFEIWFGYDKLGDVVFDATWNEGNTMLTLDPVVDLDDDSYYYIQLNGKNAAGINYYGNFYLFTEAYQNVVVVDTNLPDNGEDFPYDANPFVTFSEPMDTAMDIMLTRGGTPLDFAAAWTNGNATVTITPTLPFEMGVQYRLVFDGTNAAGNVDFYWSKYFTTFIGDDAFIVTTNTEDDDVPVDGNIEVMFNKPIDRETLEVSFSGLSNPLYGTVTWVDDENIVFNPDAQLYPATTYTFCVEGMAQDGGDLDECFTFDTAGGIEAVWNNIRQLDGTYNGFPINSDIEIKFNMMVNLDAEGTSIMLTRNDFDPDVEVLFVESLSADGLTLIVNPDQNLQLDTEYTIYWTVGSFLLDDTTSGSITFRTEKTPTAPVEVVSGVILDEEWEGNYDETSVEFTWAKDPNATWYYIYAKYADAAKDDFIRVASIAQPMDDEDTVTGTVDLTGGIVDPDFDEFFDTRDNDTPQTPFEGGAVLEFKVTAFNSLGEGPASGIVTVEDVFGPDGDFTAQDSDVDGDPLTVNAEDGTADDTAFADEADLVVMLQFDADEYLDHDTTPVVTITEDYDNNGGDPDYMATLGDITFEDMDGYTTIWVEIIVADGMNGSGDLVAIEGFLDSSGNAVAEDTEIDPWVLVDTTPPSGAFTAQAESADNSTGVAVLEFEVTFTATELLDETVAPTVVITDGGNVTDVASYVPASYVYSVVDGVSVVTLTLSVPIGQNAAEDVVSINGLTDLAPVPNVQTVAVEWALLDTTAPGGDWTAQSASAQNYTGADATITVTYTASELLLHPGDDGYVAPTFTVADGGYLTELAVDADNMAFVDVAGATSQFVTEVSFDLTIPAGDNAQGDIVTVEGLIDIYGNVDAATYDWTLLDTTAPAAPVGLAATASADYDAFVDLDWTDNTEADLATYTVYRGTAPGGPYTELAAGVATSDYTDDTAVLGTTYYYVVTAVDDSANESANSAEVFDTPVDTTAPAQAQNLTANGSLDAPATITVNWDDTTEPAENFDHYNVYRALVANFGVAALVSSPTVSEGIDNTVSFNTNYYYWVTVVDDAGNESAEQIVGPAAAVNTTPPAVPADLVASDGAATEIVLNWTANTEVDCVGYGVYVNNASPATDGTLINVPGAATDTYTVTGLTTGVTYYFTIRASDGTNTSAPAAEISYVCP
ncbi:Ig-like domain-containing protein [bacterium]|nr:Ig-like domain-containing protein [bacterium]